MDSLEEAEGATGGKVGIKDEDLRFIRKYSSDRDSISSHHHTNASSSFNHSQPARPTTSISPKQVYHNHTYYLQPGQISREEKEAEIKREKEERATRSRDNKRAKALKIPFSVEEIIYLPVDRFTELLSRYSLSDAQHQLIRDIRRRGKNKAAAQNCRKRKLEVIQTLEEEVEGLRRRRDSLGRDKMSVGAECAQIKAKLARLQADLLGSLRDQEGQRYDPEEYSLQRTADGDVILVPRNGTGAAEGNVREDRAERKRKPKRKD